MAMTPSASRSRRRDCEPTTPIRIVSRPPTSSVASARPWRASGCPTAMVQSRSPRCTRFSSALGSPSTASPCTSAIFVFGGRWAPTAARTAGTENVASNAPDAPELAARTGTATARLRGEPPTAGSTPVERVSPLRIAPCSAVRAADCWIASRVGSPLPRDVE
jgi:hypothetical protein